MMMPCENDIIIACMYKKHEPRTVLTAYTVIIKYKYIIQQQTAGAKVRELYLHRQGQVVNYLFLVGKLYAVGGLVCGVGVHSGAPFRYCDNGSECFDPDTGQWSRVPPMNQCRSNHTVQPLGKGM